MTAYISLLLSAFAEMFSNTFRFKRNQATFTTDLKGKVVVITGANTGIGKVTARELAKRGANVIIGCRDVNKGNQAIDDIRKQYPEVNIRLIRLDLSSQASVRQFAKEVCEQESQIDILINNAGVCMGPKHKTEDGFEMHFATNHLGHFLLTHLLMKRLKTAPKARIVNVSSSLYMIGKIYFDDINLDRNYSPSVAYNQSKLANLLFSRELARKLSNTNINVYCLHPGLVRTEAQRHLFKDPSYFTNTFLDTVAISADMGAQTTLYCAVDERVSNESGYYYSDCRRVDKLTPNGRDDDTARKLWQLSAELVKLENHLILN